MSNVYWELEEASYGQGAAKMVKIAPLPIPPSELAVTLFGLFYHNPEESFSSHKLSSEMSLYEPDNRRLAVRQLARHRVVINEPETPFTYRLNIDYLDEASQKPIAYKYAKQLREAYRQSGGEIKDHPVKNLSE